MIWVGLDDVRGALLLPPKHLWRRGGRSSAPGLVHPAAGTGVPRVRGSLWLCCHANTNSLVLFLPWTSGMASVTSQSRDDLCLQLLISYSCYTCGDLCTSADLLIPWRVSALTQFSSTSQPPVDSNRTITRISATEKLNNNYQLHFND